MIVGFDAKRIVRNGTGLGSYGRTLVNDIIRRGDNDITLRLYAPDKGRDDLRNQILDGAAFCYPSLTANANYPSDFARQVLKVLSPSTTSSSCVILNTTTG